MDSELQNSCGYAGITRKEGLRYVRSLRKVSSFKQQVSAKSAGIRNKKPILNDTRPIYTTSVLGTAPLKMGTRAQNFEHGTSVFCRVNATKIGTGAENVEGAETFSRGSLGTSSKGCRAQILKKSKICLASHMRKLFCSFQKWQQATN